MSEDAVEVGSSSRHDDAERENEVGTFHTKQQRQLNPARRALQDVSNAPVKGGNSSSVDISPNFSKRPRSESMEVIEESAVEKRTRSMHNIEPRTSIPVNPSYAGDNNSSPVGATENSGQEASFIVRVALDHSIGPEPLYGDEEYEDDLDPQMCAEYAPDIYEFMYRTQEQYMVNPSYIDVMPSGHRWSRNRSTLLNWLLSVHRKFRLVAETLYLAANIVDRFLSRESISLEQVQLLAAASLFIASKYEEVMTPTISNFAYIANSNVEDFRMMEQRVLVVLEFELGYPCPLNFLRRISRADDYDMRTRTVAKFILEISIFEPQLMVFRPSDVAAASMYVARQILDAGPWSANFVYYSGGCTEAGLAPIVDIINEYLQGPCEKRDPEFIRQHTSRKVLRSALLAIRWARGEEEDVEEQHQTQSQPQSQSQSQQSQHPEGRSLPQAPASAPPAIASRTNSKSGASSSSQMLTALQPPKMQSLQLQPAGSGPIEHTNIDHSIDQDRSNTENQA